MNALKVAAILLVLAGAFGLMYGSFSYTSDRHTARIGPFAMTVNEKETVNIPLWAGVGAMVLGGVILIPKRR
jgi:drug/metabolite transporter (DMT)-like permease